MCLVLSHRCINQILETIIWKNKTLVEKWHLHYMIFNNVRQYELTISAWELHEILVRLQLSVWTLWDAQSHRFNLSFYYVDVAGFQEKHIPVTTPWKEMVIQWLFAHGIRWSAVSASLNAWFHTLSGGVVQAAELDVGDFGILLTAGVPVAVVPWYEPWGGPCCYSEATDAELP